MSGYHFASGLLGIGLASTILYLIRRDHLYLGDGIFWIAAAIAALLFGFAPNLIDRLGAIAGIAYPPTLLMLVAIAVLLLKALHADILSARMRRDIRRLNQKLSIIDTEVKK